MRQRFRRLSDWLGLNDGSTPSEPDQDQQQQDGGGGDIPRPTMGRRISRKAIPGLPRPATFKRQLSEQRERLMPHESTATEPRKISSERRRTVSAPHDHLSSSLPLPDSPPPPFSSTEEQTTAITERQRITAADEKPPSSEPDVTEIISADLSPRDEDPPPPFSPWSEDEDDLSEAALEEELDKRWILNLSMHFRDQSDREKFFVTFAETPTRWRRLTISLDYRDAPPDSLEQDLKELRYQREKSLRIYESIRESLSEIQFFNTVTNLKLQTTDGRLHVHVTQDVNEIISYPARSTIKHLECPIYPEKVVEFDSHLSGFVYKVNVNGRVFIKKEIPGPDAVDEFLYEINALHSLRDSENVIRFGGVIVDDEGGSVKGLLISFASKGTMIDLLYEEKGSLSWARRQRWAHQIIRGLSEIHEAGFVQGDLTLSNVVIDEHDDAQIIDINRRGCPVGWEPPEMKGLIANNQKVGIYIGVKSDLYQLGMVLWSLAMENDEPEVEIQRGASTLDGCSGDVPGWYQDVVKLCLSERPQGRVSAKELLGRFPEKLDGESEDIDDIKVDEEDHSHNRKEDLSSAFEANSAHIPLRGRTLYPDHFGSEEEDDEEPSTVHPIPIPSPSFAMEDDFDEEEPQIISISPPASRSATPSPTRSPTISPTSPHTPSNSISQPLSIPRPETDTETTTTMVGPNADTDKDTTNQSTGHETQPSHNTPAVDRWEEMEIQGNSYLIRRSELERLKLEVDDEDDDEAGKEAIRPNDDATVENTEEVRQLRQPLQQEEKEMALEESGVGSRPPVDDSSVAEPFHPVTLAVGT
ncbi:MAG: hypothetical protein M1816_000155 [Peltula sp. TS41687]|nr:MAG: hypothetical protein M1816_000155 [Peltula sp. TS41687]